MSAPDDNDLLNGIPLTEIVHGTTLAERRAKVAERYRDDKTGACLTCQATAECSGYTKLICRWCEEAEEASEVERDDATEDE